MVSDGVLFWVAFCEMKKLRLLDLFCGAGGAAMGYHRAGFEVVGVDIKSQPHFPFEFHQADAITYPLASFDVIHASPPCQRYTSLKAMWNRREHPDLIDPIREKLIHSGLPWVIENVPGAPLLGFIILCGSMFRLGCAGAELRRHRLFECPLRLSPPSPCNHGWSGDDTATIGVYGHAGGSSHRQRYCVIGVYGGHGRDRRRKTNGQHFPTSHRKQAMGIDWMTGQELSQAIPPAYTEFIGKKIIEMMTDKIP
jgi:DNA (cytosine-5)-methyltransferase 1